MFSVRNSFFREKKFSSTLFGDTLRRREGDTLTDNNALFIAHQMRKQEEQRKKRKSGNRTER